MVVGFLEAAIEVVEGVVECGIIDMDLERVDSDNGSYTNLGIRSGRGIVKQMYHIACAFYRPAKQIAHPTRSRRRSRTWIVNSSSFATGLDLPSTDSCEVWAGELGKRMKRDAVNGAEDLKNHNSERYC